MDRTVYHAAAADRLVISSRFKHSFVPLLLHLLDCKTKTKQMYPVKGERDKQNYPDNVITNHYNIAHIKTATLFNTYSQKFK